MIYTQEELDKEVSATKGTWVKRRNLRNKLIRQSNSEVMEKIYICKGTIRDLRAMGTKEEVLRHWYAKVTKYELMFLE